MKKLFINLFASLTFVFLASNAFAQLRTPAPSPSTKVIQTVGLTEVVLEYSRPGVKGRKIFGGDEALEQYGEKWRTGANQATKISFDKDVQVGGKDLGAGSYAILTIPGEKEWAVMFYEYEQGNFGTYLDKEPDAKVMVESMNAGRKVESFTIDINNLRDNSATIDLMWDQTLVSVPLTVHTKKQIMANFKKMQEGPSPNEYYAMGQFMANNDEDLGTALKYIQKATHSDNPRFWQVHQEALLLGKMGKYSEAIKVAKKSIELAKAANNQDYVSLNEKAIASFQKKM